MQWRENNTFRQVAVSSCEVPFNYSRSEHASGRECNRWCSSGEKVTTFCRALTFSRFTKKTYVKHLLFKTITSIRNRQSIHNAFHQPKYVFFCPVTITNILVRNDISFHWQNHGPFCNCCVIVEILEFVGSKASLWLELWLFECK